MGSGTISLGGLVGIIVPAYLLRSPEVPDNSGDAHRYFASFSQRLHTR
jgi:hypothetical protein